MKNTLQMLVEAKEKDKQEIHMASLAKVLDQAFPKSAEASTPAEEPV